MYTHRPHQGDQCDPKAQKKTTGSITATETRHPTVHHGTIYPW